MTRDGWRDVPFISRREAIGAAKAMAEEIKRLQHELAGAALINYAIAMRQGGELRLTQQEILDSTGGKLQVAHAQTGEWVLTAVPDPTQPYVKAMTDEDVTAYEAMVARQEAAHGNGGDRACVEGDNVLDTEC